MTFPIGSSVRVHSPGYTSTHGRTGVVTDDALKFPWRDCRAVAFDHLEAALKSLAEQLGTAEAQRRVSTRRHGRAA